MSDAFDGREPSLNNSGAIHRSVPARVGAVTVMLSDWLRSTLVSPKSAMRAEKLPSIKMLLYGSSAGIERWKNSTYAFQIGVNGRPVMEILQSTSDVRQLRKSGRELLQVYENTYQFQSIGLRTCSNKVHDCPVFHPFGNHHQDVRGFSCPEQWQQVWVFKLFP